MRWATPDEVDRTLEVAKSRCIIPIKVGDYRGPFPFKTVVSMVTMLPSNISISSLNQNITCPLHLFYLNCFIKMRKIKGSTDSKSVHEAAGDN